MTATDWPAEVRRLRTLLALSQEKFAKQLGVTFSTVNRWENGKVLPSKLARHTLTALAAVLAKQENHHS